VFFFPTKLFSHFCLLAEGRIRHRREGIYNNYGGYASDGQQNNPLIVGNGAYQYPTPVNVINGGQYNPQQYDTYPDNRRDYYGKRIRSNLSKKTFLLIFRLDNMNDMRLSSSGGWNGRYQPQRHPWLLFSIAPHSCANMSTILLLLLISLISHNILCVT
jgi:hypothetical protein